MRARLILFLAPALFVTGLLLVLASALVSDLEPPAVAESAFAIEPIRTEASCAVIQRQVDSLARALEQGACPAELRFLRAVFPSCDSVRR
jgi:hypothetical protein